MKRVFVILFLFLSTTSVFAETSVLDTYIKTALKGNLALKQKEYSYQKSLEALKESKRMFFPTLSFEARYSLAEGGRTVTLPFGDMMNPLYNNLNAINQSLNLPVPQYPKIENQSLSFVRSPEQETKLVASVPIFNAAIIQNHRIRKNIVDVEKISVDIYRRELVKEIKESYIKILQAEKIYKLYSNTLSIVNLSLKSRQSLFTNGKITIDEVYTAKAQVIKVKKDLTEADKNRIMASSWFNFLLNRNFDTEVEIEEIPVSVSNYNLADLKKASLSNREEFNQLDKHIEIKKNTVKLEKGAALPKVSIGGQYGFQGEDYSFNKESRFSAIGINLSWSLFTSGQRKSKISQAQIDQKILENHKKETELRVQMETTETYYSLKTAKQGIDLTREELKYFHQSYLLIEKKYKLGIVNYLEYSTALNNKINAENKYILAQYTYLLEQIKLEREVSSYEF